MGRFPPSGIIDRPGIVAGFAIAAERTESRFMVTLSLFRVKEGSFLKKVRERSAGSFITVPLCRVVSGVSMEAEVISTAKVPFMPAFALLTILVDSRVSAGVEFVGNIVAHPGDAAAREVRKFTVINVEGNFADDKLIFGLGIKLIPVFSTTRLFDDKVTDRGRGVSAGVSLRLGIVELESFIQSAKSVVPVGEIEAHFTPPRAVEGVQIVAAFFLHCEHFIPLRKRCAEFPNCTVVGCGDKFILHVEVTVRIDHGTARAIGVSAILFITLSLHSNDAPREFVALSSVSVARMCLCLKTQQVGLHDINALAHWIFAILIGLTAVVFISVHKINTRHAAALLILDIYIVLYAAAC